MADDSKDKNREVDQIEFKPWHWKLAGALLSIMLSIPIIVHFSISAVDIKAMWGDFFGGTLNPLFTLLTFLALIYTIILQRNELGLSRRELELTREEVAKSAIALNEQNKSFKQQRFETTLFNMIGVFNQIIDTMDIGTGNDIDKGRDCFSYFVRNFKGIYKTGYQDVHRTIYFRDRPHDFNRVIDSYNLFYESYASNLGHYFRVLYNILNFIKESDYSGLSDQSANRIYAKILRAQLSDQELLILYYNCLSDHGAKFKQLAIEFELFDNLQLDTLIRPEHYDLMDKKAFGDNQTKLQENPSE